MFSKPCLVALLWCIPLIYFPPAYSFSFEMSIVGLSSKVVVKPDFVAPFLQAFKRYARLTRTEPDCLQFVIGRQVDPVAENVFFSHNQFRDAAALETHEKTSHFLEFREQTQAYLDESLPGVTSLYKCPHEPVERQPTSGYCLNVESIVKPELVEDYDQLIISHSANSRKEPACIQFDWGKAEPNEEGQVSFFFHEEYIDRAGFEAHTVTPHFERFVKFNESKLPYVIPQIVDFFEIIDYTKE